MKVFRCKNCRKKFTKKHNPQREYKFCSYQCRADFDSKTSRVEKPCKNCGELFHPNRNNTVQVYCSKRCFNKFKDNGKSTIAQKIRSSLEYEEWRKKVFERDLYTCQMCGGVGGKLNADHIKRFSEYPELRLDVSNGRTLCEECHRQTENYGNRKNSADTKWDLLAYLDNF